MRASVSWLLVGIVGIAMASATASCLMSSSDCSFDGTCPGFDEADGSSREAGATEAGAPDSEGGPSEPPVPPGCDPNADAKDSPPCAVNSYALFVNVNATDGGDGTKERPYRSIQAALDAVPKAGKHRVYVCGSSTYAEHLKMTASSYARLHGGFDCTTWSPAADKPRVAPSDAGYALHIDAVPSEVRVEDVALEAIAGTASSRSSIAVFVASSPNVRFVRAEIKANAGANGADGDTGKPGVSNPVNLDGLAATPAAGGLAKTCTCDTGGTSVGGQGGNTSDATVDGARGLPIIDPASPVTATGEGQSSAACNTGGTGAKDGSNGKRGEDALRAAVGRLDASGWHPGDGASGKNGTPGQGGGGAGARTAGAVGQTGGGGGGGCGGCGGGGGTGGTAGGSSIAVLSAASGVSLRGGRLSVADAGKGGAGKTGSGGGLGGGKGSGGGTGGCAGALGGSGGNGGSGAGGAGGSSVGVLYAGSPPTLAEAVEVVKGKKGAGGLGGAPTSNDGPAGLEGDVALVP